MLRKINIQVPPGVYTNHRVNGDLIHRDQVFIPAKSYQLFVGKNVSRRKSESRLADWLNAKGKRVYITDHFVRNHSVTYSGKPAHAIVTDINKDRSDPYAQGKVRYSYYQSVVEVFLNNPTVYTVYKSPIDSDELITSALAEANSRTFDVGTFIGELPETIGYLLDILVRFWKLYSLFRKRGLPGTIDALKRGAKNPENYAGLWLEFRYAVMPLFYSARDALKALEPPEMEFRRTTAKDTNVESTNTSHDINYWLYNASFHVDETVKVKVYTFMSAEQTSRAKFLLNPITTAWELIPLSFVVDWFIQVGDFIASFDCVPHESRGLTISRRVSSLFTLSLDGASQSRYDLDASYEKSQNLERSASYPGGDRIIVTDDSYERVANPSFSHELPINIQLNWKRWLDAAALSYVIGQSFITKRK